MTEKEFKLKMKELGWDDNYIDEIIADQKDMALAGLNPPPFETYVDNPIIND